MGDVQEILLPAVTDGNRSDVRECLPGSQSGPNHFVLLHSPGLVEGLAAGDEIELAPQETPGYRMLRRGGNICVWVFFDSQGPSDVVMDQMSGRVTSIGGKLDGGTRRSLIFTIPVGVGLPRISALFSQAEREGLIPGWMYGNVSEPDADASPSGDGRTDGLEDTSNDNGQLWDEHASARSSIDTLEPSTEATVTQENHVPPEEPSGAEQEARPRPWWRFW